MAGISLSKKASSPRKSKRYLTQCAGVLNKAEHDYEGRWSEYFYNKVNPKVDREFWFFVDCLAEIAANSRHFDHTADEFMRRIDIGQINRNHFAGCTDKFEPWDYVVFSRTWNHVKYQYHTAMDNWDGFGLSDDGYEYFCDGLPFCGEELYKEVCVNHTVVNAKQVHAAIRQLKPSLRKVIGSGEGYEHALYDAARNRYRWSLR